jgi:hypothetical protein
MRSFRAENLSLLVKNILDLDKENAKSTPVIDSGQISNYAYPGFVQGEGMVKTNGKRK